MWTLTVVLVLNIHQISGAATLPEGEYPSSEDEYPSSEGEYSSYEYNGCYSTEFVNQYSSFYKLRKSMTIEQGFAACNHRLTSYIGLQVDGRFPNNTVVYCGDLVQVSYYTRDGCSPCPENATFSCGGNESMAVYMLRESTPLALLLHTGGGVEMLIDNTTTLQVPIPPHLISNDTKNSVEYIYTDDCIVTHTDRSVYRSYYNIAKMEFSVITPIYDNPSSTSAFAVDFTTRSFFTSTNTENKIHITTVAKYSYQSRSGEAYDNVPEQISVDPYNRSLVFVQSPYNIVHVMMLDDDSLVNHTLKHLNIKQIKVLTMDSHEKYLYAIAILIDALPIAHLVRIDYNFTKMEVVYNGTELENATALEVFRDHAVWLTNKDNVSTVFKCKLSPLCCYENLNSYSSGETIYDFTIYHPEKQTPGRKGLCADKSICSYGCQLVSPFTVRCIYCSEMKENAKKLTCVGREFGDLVDSPTEDKPCPRGRSRARSICRLPL